MNLQFVCTDCGASNVIEFPTASEPKCAGCGKAERLIGLDEKGGLSHCAACGNDQLYRMKDFPQWLGMGLLATACILFYFFAISYQYAIAWSILLGSAALDGLIYLIVGDVVVCYRCGARHRGIPSRGFDPHEIAIAEKYRQERLRREQFQANQRR
jgi:hypothetical protein